MKKKSTLPLPAAGLRRQAEAQLQARPSGPPAAAALGKPDAGSPRLLHELQIHQVELELQNAELEAARNRMEALLEKYTDLYDFAPAGYLSLDESGVILEANLSGARLLGVERAQLLKRRLPPFVSAASRPEFLAFLKKLFTGTRNQDCEMPLSLADDAVAWMSFQGLPAVVLQGTPKWCRMTFTDITARRQAEAALRQSEERFRALFEMGPVAIYSCDTAGAIQQYNHRAAELWGRQPELSGAGERFCGSFNLLLPDGRSVPRAQCPMADVVTGKKNELRNQEVIIERPDGTRITVLANIRALLDKQGKITGAINCFYDITDRKRMESGRQRAESAALANQKLEREITRQLAKTAALQQAERHKSQLLAQSRLMQEHLRHFSREVLKAQEEERRRISRELHDVIAQTLTGINLRLAALKKTAGLNTADFDRNLAKTQKLVEKSVDSVHRFARELRPAVLDDLGLIPALHSFLKTFTAQTGVRTHLTAFAGVEQLDALRRTTLYRVAQEALTNVSRHARATRVEVILRQLPGGHVCLTVKDDGQAFSVAHTLAAGNIKRLGLLGMRERLEMVGGHFDIESTPGQGTTVLARIPFGKPARGKSPVASAAATP